MVGTVNSCMPGYCQIAAKFSPDIPDAALQTFPMRVMSLTRRTPRDSWRRCFLQGEEHGGPPSRRPTTEFLPTAYRIFSICSVAKTSSATTGSRFTKALANSFSLWEPMAKKYSVVSGHERPRVGQLKRI
jgi:hypothetical protein